MTDTNTDDKTKALHDVYASTSAEQSAAIYDDWSAEYEEHMRGSGYSHPAMVSAMLARYHPAGSAPILDAGSGTGILGEILTALGYSCIHGFDASPGMLAHAASKGFYKDLRPGLLGETLEYGDNSFAACTASGVFTQGHAPLEGLDELIRVTQPGGHVVFSISRTYLGEHFEARAQKWADEGKWRQVDASLRYDSTPHGENNLVSQVFAFEII